METSGQHTATAKFVRCLTGTSFPGSFISLWGGEMQDPGNKVDLTDQTDLIRDSKLNKINNYY